MTMRTLNLIGIAGSLRRASRSRAMLDGIAGLLPAGCRFSSLEIGAMPHYDADLEASGLPASVAAARTRVAAADGVILIAPEYNHGMPGVLKNALDWLSRPVRASCMQGMPVFFATQSAGALGGVRAQHSLRETLASMLCQLVPMAEIAVTFADQKIRDGRIVDAPTLTFIQAQLDAFLAVLPTNRTAS
jgi:chromate reductase